MKQQAVNVFVGKAHPSLSPGSGGTVLGPTALDSAKDAAPHCGGHSALLGMKLVATNRNERVDTSRGYSQA